MSRRMQPMGIDVLTAAKERLRHIFDLHDSVAVCFSGGKDSLVALHLTREIAEERGQHVVNVIFRDEELIPSQVIDFVEEYRAQPWVKMYYYAVPLASTKFILGRSIPYVQWDPARAHIRPRPEHAIVLPEGDTRIMDQYTMDEFSARPFPGKAAFVTGIRASESIMRFRASVNKLNDNYINASSTARVSLCKPLYDWQENDIFKFFWERNIRYCDIYNSQHVAGSLLRVSTPLHAEASKKLGLLRSIDPRFYQQIVDLFPEMLDQERYYSQLDHRATEALYGQSIDGIRSYILEKIDDEHQQRAALKRLDGIIVRWKKSPAAYPLGHILNYFASGVFKRELLPLRVADQKAVKA